VFIVVTGLLVIYAKNFGSIPGRTFSLLEIKNFFGNHPASYYLTDKCDPFPGVELQDHEIDHSLLSKAEFKNEWIFTSAPLCAFAA
jgi:hypothetical protein